MSKRLIRRLAVLGSAVVIAAPLLSTTPSAMADNIAVTTGTWAQSSPPGGGNPPPNFPDGGMWVSASSSQDLALAAISFPASGDAATLTLHVHQATPPPLPGVSYTIGLCLADPPTWKPPTTSPGAMSDAPKRNCDGHEIDSKAIVDSSNAVLFRTELNSTLISTDASGNKAFNFEIFVKADQFTDGATGNGLPQGPPPNIDLQFEKVNPSADIFVLGAEPSDSSSSSAESAPITSSDTTPPSSSVSDTGSSSSNSLGTGSVSGVGGAPLPGVSVAGEATPAPTTAPANNPPQVALGNKPQSLPLQPAANKGPSDRDRILLGLLMLGLIGWTLIRDQLPSAQRRPSLYDLPTKPSAS